MAGKGEAKLTEEARAFVVQQLAMYDAPSVVAKALKADFGLVITPQAIEAYDPTKRAGAKLSEKWRVLFEATRTKFLEDSATIGIANRSVRLRRLDRMAAQAETMGNIVVAAQLFEQAAKEMGNAYTNRRELTGKDGAALIPKPIAPDMTPKEAAEAWADTVNDGG